MKCRHHDLQPTLTMGMKRLNQIQQVCQTKMLLQSPITHENDDHANLLMKREEIAQQWRD